MRREVAGLVATKPSSTPGHWNALDHVSPTELRKTAKFAQYGLAAAAEALEDAGFKAGNGLDAEMTGVCLGSGIGNLEELYATSVAYAEGRNYRKIHPLFVPRLLINLGAGHVSLRPAEASRPFDKDRDGFVIGEGAACVVLEELQQAKRRGARIYAELSGYGCSADAHHLTAPQEEGAGALLAMKKALKQAKIAPEKVDYINAHATSTPLGDAAENRAIKTLMLGEGGRTRAADVHVSSSKGAIGHLLGAAGAIEAIFSILALHDGVLPPTINLTSRTAGFDCNYVPNEAQEHKVGVVLTNSFGFGGTNASLCFTSVQ
ncbi:hypothetical protein DV737_g5732, partial [Chaetothyriales sp. CBS 132003]